MLVVEQVLEIIFTLLTLNVPDELPVAPAPAPPLMLPAVLPEVEPLTPALPDAEPLGLVELLLEALLLSDPLIRT